MTKNKASQFKYLEEVELSPEDTPTISVPLDFQTIEYARPTSVVVDGVDTEASKFCAKGFPSQNLSHFYLIPLYLNPNARQMFIETYGGEAQPPDCDSLDGVKPSKPLTYNNQVIEYCSQCPLFGYGKEFRCKNKAVLIGLAYFPNHNDLLVPVRKFIPGTSVSNTKDLARALITPVNFGGTWRRLPEWSRIVRVYSDVASNTWKTRLWAFDLLDSDSNYDDMPHNFVPEHLIEEVRKFVPAAGQWVGDSRFLQLATPQLPGGAEPKAIASTPAAEVKAPIPDPTVVAEEEASDY